MYPEQVELGDPGAGQKSSSSSGLPGPTPPSWIFLTGSIMKGSCRPVLTLWTESASAAGRVCLDR